MDQDLQSRKFLRFSSIFCICIGLVSFSGPVRGGPPSEDKAADSLSVGVPMNGTLTRGEVLPKTGAGYELLANTTSRKSRFGITELVMLIKDAAGKVRRKHKGSLLQVGDLSARKGGRVDHHGSHQNGRDVDLAFYMIDAAGKPVRVPGEFIAFDANGYSIDPPMAYRFDAVRNWALIDALVNSSRAQVQWIFVASHVEALLLAEAQKAGASKATINRAKQVLKQPKKSSHWDHFHVRIYCPPGDRPTCEDTGPKWAWAD